MSNTPKKSVAWLVIGLLIAAGIALGLWWWNTALSATEQPCSATGQHRYCMADISKALATLNEPFTYVFKIKDESGQVQKDFARVNERLMHFFIVREDLSNFQHVHPEFDPVTGEFKQKLQLTAPGAYRIFTEYAPRSAGKDDHGNALSMTNSSQMTVAPGRADSQKLTPHTSTDVAGYHLDLTSRPVQLRAGEPVELGFSAYVTP